LQPLSQRTQTCHNKKVTASDRSGAVFSFSFAPANEPRCEVEESLFERSRKPRPLLLSNPSHHRLSVPATYHRSQPPKPLPHFFNQHYSESIMTYSYKLLTTSDVPLLKNLVKVFGQAFNELPTYQHAVPSDTYLQSLLAKPHFVALTAMQANEVIGGLAAYVLEKFEQDRREIYIYDLAISEAHRRKGVATHLIKTFQQIAKEKTPT
jgi:aminoglycoside 3-N-acetyltransferase I